MLDTTDPRSCIGVTRHTSLCQALTQCVCRIEGAKAPRGFCMRSAELVRHASCGADGDGDSDTTGGVGAEFGFKQVP